MTAGAASTLTGYRPAEYWEARARRFAARGDGLAAVCSYGMPGFYNRLIHHAQRRALGPWLKPAPGARVLDMGCGIGRWSRLLAARGACVTGVDLSPTMIEEAIRRTRAAGLASRCRFIVQDCAALELNDSFDLIVCVTMLQHLVDLEAMRCALRRMAAHLAPGGTLVVLEAAPARRASRCDTAVFTARHRPVYLRLFGECGLRVHSISGVDPAPFKTWLLPHLPRLPRPLRLIALALATALSAPLDALCGSLLTERSWHAVFVLRHPSRGKP
jgi:2-polyprenyl-3-methyl-5-hydroxy-6-metoxy-1,4-benzoquinol methylase